MIHSWSDVQGLARNLHNMGSITCTMCRLDLNTLMLLWIFHIRGLSYHCTILSTTMHHKQRLCRKTTNQQPEALFYQPPSASFLPLKQHWQSQILEGGILRYNKAGYKMEGRNGDNGWNGQGTEAKHWQRRKNLVGNTFLVARFWWGYTWFGVWKSQIKKDQP